MGDVDRERPSRRTYEDPPSDGALGNPPRSTSEPSYWETPPDSDATDWTDVTLGAVGGMDQTDTTDVTLGAGGGGPGIPGNTTASSASSSGTGMCDMSAHDCVEARSTDAKGDGDGREGGGCAWRGPEGAWDAKGEVVGTIIPTSSPLAAAPAPVFAVPVAASAAPTAWSSPPNWAAKASW